MSRGRTARPALPLPHGHQQISVKDLPGPVHEKAVLASRVHTTGEEHGHHLIQLILRVWRRPGLLEDIPPEGVLAAAVEGKHLIAGPTVGDIIALDVQHNKAGVGPDVPAAG